jgi:hypothetical protein
VAPRLSIQRQTKAPGARSLPRSVVGKRAAGAREDAKQLLGKGIDPSQAKREREQDRQDNTFRILAEEFVSRIALEGRATETLSKTKWLLDFAYPILGDHPVDNIDAPMVRKALRKVEVRGRYMNRHVACDRR